MNKEIKVYFKCILWFIIPLIVLLLITNVLYYNDIISNNLVKYFKMIAILLSSFFGGYIRGINSNNKGYIYGLKLSSIIILIMLIMSIILKEFNLFDILYYIIIMLTITFGSMMGINRKKNN